MEIWKDIEGYEGLYQVSNEGRVKSVERVVMRCNGRPKTISERVLKPWLDKKGKGYFNIDLWKDNICKKFKLHRLIAKAFIPNPDNKEEIDHIDTDTRNNKIENLRWVTRTENLNNPITLENYSKNRKGKFLNNEWKSKKVYQYTLDDEFVKEWASVAEAERNGFTHSSICNCCNGKKESYKGFKWSYEKK